MLNRVLLLYYSTWHTWLSPSHHSQCCALPQTYPEHCARRGRAGEPDTKQVGQSEMEELGVERQLPGVVNRIAGVVNI